MKLLALLPAAHHCFQLQDLTHEEWRHVCGWEGMYKVSSLGRMRRLAKLKKNGLNGELLPEKIMHQMKNEKGYLYVELWKNNIRKVNKVHKLVGIAFISNPENKATINHKDFIKGNNIYSNLEWMTFEENFAHAFKNGKFRRGENAATAKLTNAQVIKIKELYREGMRVCDIGRKLGLKTNPLYAIVNGWQWKSVA